MTSTEDAETGPERGPTGEAADGTDGPDVPETVERTFTCVACGYGERGTVAPLVASREGVCVNCGDWTTATADRGAVVEAAREVAAALSGPAVTERQALAYLLREVVGLGRAATAEAMDTTASNVDNLQRRGAEKVAAARRLVDDLARATGDEPSTGRTDDLARATPKGDGPGDPD